MGARSAGLPGGVAGVLVDERYGQPVVDAAHSDGVVLAVPVERSGRDWFELEWGQDWIARVSASRPDYAKVLIRDNPAFPAHGASSNCGSCGRSATHCTRWACP